MFLANNSSTDGALIQHDYFANNNNAGNNSGSGIYTDGTISGGNLTNVTIDSNTFVNNYSSDGVEAACAFQATSAGEQSNIRITNNIMTGNGKATLFFNTTGVVIENNTITGCIDQGSAALRFEGNNHNVTIMFNTADNNTAPAVAVDAKGVTGDSSGFVINDNNFYNNNDAHTPALSVVFDDRVYTGTFDVRNDWWGSASGPGGDGAGTGDDVSLAILESEPAEVEPCLRRRRTLHAVAHSPIRFDADRSHGADGPESRRHVIHPGQPGLDRHRAPALRPSSVQRAFDGVTLPSGTTAAGVTNFHDTAAVAGQAYLYEVVAASSGNSPQAVPSGNARRQRSARPPSTIFHRVSLTVGYGTFKRMLRSAKPADASGHGHAKDIACRRHLADRLQPCRQLYANSFPMSESMMKSTAEKATGSVDFQVVGDGKVLFDSGDQRLARRQPE